MESNKINRRAVLGATALFGSTMLISGRLSAQQDNAFNASRSAASDLPQRANLVIRGAHIVTMDSAIGELPSGDVHCVTAELLASVPTLRLQERRL